MPAEPLALRCAAESESRGEPLLATASRVRRWLLVEQAGAWGRDAVVESRLDTEVGRRLHAEARRAGVRVLLIRRPTREQRDQRRVYLAHSGVRHRWIEQLDLDPDRPAALLDLDLGGVWTGEPPGVGQPGPPAVHLVCTNGRHDPCCADLGRPVVRALRDAGVPELWESSHVGGDRFAANVVVLPAGVYYGRVPPEQAATLLADLDAGVLDLDRFRGRSCHPPVVQAAEVLARRELDERRLDALRVGEVTRLDERTWTVALDHDATGPLAATVARERGDAQQVTCTAAGEAHPWRYRLVDLARR